MKKIAILIAALVIAAGLVAAAVSGTADEPAPSVIQDPSEDDFVPSEALPADSAISFPVDI